MGDHTPPALLLDAVRVKRGSAIVLEDVSLQVDSGVVGLIGPNGSGKSTLLRAIASLLPLAGGRVQVDGIDVSTDVRSARRRLAYLGQRQGFPGSFTVRESLEYAGWLQRMTSSETSSRADELLGALGLSAQRDARLATLSSGTRQRAAFAQAIFHTPKVVLLDEPTDGVDVEQRDLMRDAISAAATWSVVVMSTHLTEDIEFLAHHVVALRAGRLVWSGSSDQFRHLTDNDSGRSRIESAMRLLARGNEG